MKLTETQLRTLWGAVYAGVMLTILFRGAQTFQVFSALAAFYTAREVVRMKTLSWGLRGIFALYVVGGFYAGLVWMGNTSFGTSAAAAGPYLPERMVVPFLLIWASDSFAYLGGRWLGKTPLAPALSPKKTWEGAAFGAAGVCLTAWGASAAGFDWSGSLSPALLGLGIAAAAPAGDLVESWVKRRAGVKDSGVFLPGHGGWFDRLDSYILVAWVLGGVALLQAA